MVDMRDLKSLGIEPCGFKSHSQHLRFSMIELLKIKKLNFFLSSYLLKIFARVFIITTLISAITFFYGAFNLLCDREIGAIAYIKISSIFCITILPYIIIISIILSSFFLTHKLNTTLELYALQSLGVSFFRMLATILMPVSLIFTFSFLNAHYLFPHASAKMINLGIEIIKKNPTAIIKPNVFTKDIKGLCFYAKEKVNNSSFKDVAIYKKEDDKTILALAEKATVENEDDNSLRIILENGNFYTDVYDNTDVKSVINSCHLSFEKQIIHIDLNSIFAEFGIRQDYTSFKDSLTLYKEISRKRKILEANINRLYESDKDDTRGEKKDTIKFLLSCLGIAPEESYITSEENIYNAMRGVSEEEQNRNKWKMEEIENKIRTYKKKFKEETKHAKETLMNRDSLALSCLILFLLCFSLGFLLHRYSYLKLLALSLLISICFLASLILFNTSPNNVLNIYIKYFGNILMLIPITIFSIYYANKKNFIHELELKNKIKKYKNKIKNKVKAIIIKLWQCL